MTEQRSWIDAIYEPWGGTAAELARDLGELPVTVSQWRYRGNIPPRYWPRIIAAAAVKGATLTLEQFVNPDHEVVDSAPETNPSCGKSDDVAAQVVAG